MLVLDHRRAGQHRITWPAALLTAALVGCWTVDASPADNGDATQNLEPAVDAGLKELAQQMHQVSLRLADGQLDTALLQQQAAILAALQRSTGTASTSAGSAGTEPAGSGTTEQQPAAASQNQDVGQTQPGGSTQAARPERLPDSILPYWNQLPPSQSARIRSMFPERFLPGYEDAIVQYYEQLGSFSGGQRGGSPSHGEQQAR